MNKESFSTPIHKIQDLPGPSGLPLLGNLLQIKPIKLHLILENWSDQYGSIYKLKLVNKQIVAIADSDLILEILKARPKRYRRMSTMDSVLREMRVNGVFSAEGEDWSRQRGVIMQALSTDHLRQFFITLVEITERLRNCWDDSALNGQSIEVKRDLIRYTTDVTTSLAFGYDGNTLECSNNQIQQHLEQIFPMISHRINSPFQYWRVIKLPADRLLDKSLAAIHHEILEMVKQCKIRLKNDLDSTKHPRNVLEAMLMTHQTEDVEFSDEEIYGNVLTMLLAGEDTTANTMAWMLHFMTEYPDVQHKMQHEADAILGGNSLLNQFEDASKFHYIEAVAYETLRLKSVAPLIFLEALEDHELNGMNVPKGTALFLLTRHSAIQDKAFTNAKQFKPERWLDKGRLNFPCHNTNAFIPFGAGPRFCPGRNLALLEIKTVMAMLCKNFSVSNTKDCQAVEESFAFTMNPTNIQVEFNKR